MEWVYIYGGIAVFCGGIATGLAIYRKCVIDDLELLTKGDAIQEGLRQISNQVHYVSDHVEVLRLSK